MTTALKDFVLIPIADIDIGQRCRKDPEKEIQKLKGSIEAVGLLQPIVVVSAPDNGTYRLVAGQRRILACQRLGHTDIKAYVAPDMDEAMTYQAEGDENTCRVQFNIAEARAVYKKQKEIYAALAKANEEAGTTLCSAEQRVDSSKEGAKGTGLSSATHRRIDEMEAYAANEDLPEHIRELATINVALVESGEKKVNTALNEIKNALSQWGREAAANDGDTEEGEEDEESDEPVQSDEPVFRNQKKLMNSAMTALEKATDALEAAFLGATNYDDGMNPEMVKDNWKIVTDYTKRINRVAKVRI
jgi:ParB-like chromosome segregation protein Spo0J